MKEKFLFPQKNKQQILIRYIESENEISFNFFNYFCKLTFRRVNMIIERAPSEHLENLHFQRTSIIKTLSSIYDEAPLFFLFKCWLSEHSGENILSCRKFCENNKRLFNSTWLCGYYVYFSLLCIYKCFQYSL